MGYYKWVALSIARKFWSDTLNFKDVDGLPKVFRFSVKYMFVSDIVREIIQKTVKMSCMVLQHAFSGRGRLGSR